MNDLLTVSELADILRVDATTVRRWVKYGVLEAVSLPHAKKRQSYRIKRETLEKLLNNLLPVVPAEWVLLVFCSARAKGDFTMSLVLTGVVNGCRPVVGTVQQGERKGEEWKFLSLEVIDPRYGKVYSCQLRDKDPQFKDLVNGDKMAKELTGHKVKVTVMGITAGQREIEDRDTGDTKTIIQMRCQVTNIRDLDVPADEDE